MRSRGAVGKATCGADWPDAAKAAGAALARTPPAVRMESFSRKERRVSGFMVFVVGLSVRIVRRL